MPCVPFAVLCVSTRIHPRHVNAKHKCNADVRCTAIAYNKLRRYIRTWVCSCRCVGAFAEVQWPTYPAPRAIVGYKYRDLSRLKCDHVSARVYVHEHTQNGEMTPRVYALSSFFAYAPRISDNGNKYPFNLSQRYKYLSNLGMLRNLCFYNKDWYRVKHGKCFWIIINLISLLVNFLSHKNHHDIYNQLLKDKIIL